MSKEEFENITDDIENNFDEAEATKNLCVHDLKRKLKEKQKQEKGSKVIIFFTLVFLIGFLLLLIY